MSKSGDTDTSVDDAVVDNDQTTGADVGTDAVGVEDDGVDTTDADIDGDDDFDEEATFAEIAEARSKGTRFDAMSGDDDDDADTAPDKDGGGKGKGEGEGEGEDADKDAKINKQDDSDKSTEADKGGDEPDGRNDSTAQPPAQPPASVVFQPGARYEDIRDDLLQSIGDVEIEPADGDTPAMTFKEFEEDFPGVTRAIVAISQRLNAGANAYIAQQQAVQGRDALITEVSKEVSNASEILASSDFNTWFDGQPATIKELGYNGGKTEAVKLLRLYGAERPGALKAVATSKAPDDPKTAESKRKRLGVIAAGSTGSQSRGGGGEHLSDTASLIIDGKEFMDDEDADRIFNEYATKKSNK